MEFLHDMDEMRLIQIASLLQALSTQRCDDLTYRDRVPYNGIVVSCPIRGVDGTFHEVAYDGYRFQTPTHSSKWRGAATNRLSNTG